MSIFTFKNSGDVYDLIWMILYSILALCWLWSALVYCIHHFKFHARKIAEWKKELNTINIAEWKEELKTINQETNLPKT